MIYTIKAIPTVYGGVQFRSRLEARWAAFFDLAGISWDYEPFDLDGWAPDFLLKTDYCHVLAEVKPVEISGRDYSEFDKASVYQTLHQILLLGVGPRTSPDKTGIVMDPPNDAPYDWVDIAKALTPTDLIQKWREAGNRVQWWPDGDELNYHEQINRIFKRKAA